MPRLVIVDRLNNSIRFCADTPANEGQLRQSVASAPSTRSYHRLMVDADPKLDDSIMSADLGKTGAGTQVVLYIDQSHRNQQLRLSLHTGPIGKYPLSMSWRQVLMTADMMQVLADSTTAASVVTAAANTIIPNSIPDPSDRTIRLLADHEFALSRGLAGPPPVYSLGTPIVDLGKGNWKSSRREWEDTPTTVEGLTRVIEVVRKEQRLDVETATSDIRMLDDGRLAIGNSPLAMEENGLKQLLSMLRREMPVDTDGTVASALFPAAMSAMSALDPDHRAAIFNAHLKRNGSKSQRLQLRTRVVKGQQQVFSVTSTGYNAFDADAVAAQLRAGLYQLDGGRQARGPVTYDPATTTLKADAIWHAPLPYDGGSAGDYFKGGMTFRSNDAKGGGIRGLSELWRNLCLNLIIVARLKKGLFSLTHRSSDDTVVEAIRSGMKTAEADFGHFLKQWGILHATPIASIKLWGQSFADVETAIRWAVEEEKITAAVGRDVLLESLLNGYNAEGGDTLDALVNSITRVHDVKYSQLVDSVVADLERQAGELVPVLVRAAS